MKILRLSFFNIKRRKREAAILILLTAIAGSFVILSRAHGKKKDGKEDAAA